MSLVPTLRRLLPIALSVGIIVLAARVLHDGLATIHPAEVASSFLELPPLMALAALGATIVGYGSLVTYEVLMLAHVSARVSARRAAITGLIAYPIGHAVGLGALSGGAIRFRLYTAVGVDAFSVGRIVVLSAMPYALGLGVLLGLALVADAGQAAPLLGLSQSMVTAIGGATLLAHVLYLATVRWRSGPFRIGRAEFSLPPLRLTRLQYGLGLVDVACGVAALYVLLPPSADIGYPAFVAIYVLAILAGLASSVPAGLGVFEATLFTLLPGVPKDELLASVLAYRLIYEFLPFVLAIALLVATEIRLRWIAWGRPETAGSGR